MDNSGRDCILGFIMVLGKAIGIGVDPVDGGLRALLVLVGRTWVSEATGPLDFGSRAVSYNFDVVGNSGVGGRS